MSTIDRLLERVRALGPLGKDLLVDLQDLEREITEKDKRIDALTTVNALTADVARIEEQEDVDQVLQGVLTAALDLSKAERGLVVLSNLDLEDKFEIRAERNMAGSDNEDIVLSRSLIRQILERGEGINTTNVQEDDRFVPGASLMAADIRSVMATPIKLQDKVIGGIYVDSILTENIFQDEDLNTFSAFANNAAVALNLATSMKERYELYVQSILALVNAVEAADAYTAGHSSRVGYYSRGIALEMGLPDRDIQLITFGGYLHDVGKIALKNPVSKDGKLTDEEWIEMKKHPIYGERILRNSPALEEILPGVRSHHEKWAGGGYPDNIKGEEIHLYARIMSVADTFDAMTTDRPYRKAFETEYALSEIEKLKGSWYYPPAADAFLKAFADGNLSLADKTKADSELYESLAAL